MKRNVLLVAALAAGLIAGHFALVPGRAADDKKEAKKAPYVHAVIFYVKEGAPKDTAERLIADAHELLAKVPTVRDIRCGRPAEKSTPNYAKKDYDVGLLVFFDDFDGLKTYLDHELHQEYVKRHLQNIDEKKLAVYDFVDQKK